MHDGLWQKPQLRALSELTLGIVGVGNCGRAVARRAAAFGMRILGADIVAIEPPVRAATGLEQVPLERLLHEADIVSLNCTLNPTSFHLIDARALASMKRDAFLINTCRGPVVDERALEEALVSGRLAGAALDVFEIEPLPADHALWSAPNVLITPHTAGYGPYLDDRRLDILLDNCRRFAAGQPLRNVVDKASWF